jgi:glutamate-ammonia-ligase adenylyltransferase
MANPAPGAIAASASRFLEQAFSRHPEWPEDPAFSATRAPGVLTADVLAAASTCVDEAALMQTLRERRKYEMARIAWRALVLEAELDETLRDLSELADACCQIALNMAFAALERRHGTPCDEAGEPVLGVVFGMGKLGGGELNFSSDIDLIFFHRANGETRAEDGRFAAVIDNERFFIRLAQDVGRILSAQTEHGMVFRVDTMLRPFGSAGPMSMSFDAAEEYYQTHGREWERYALIKARPVAGDLEGGQELLQRLRPFVYRRYLDFNAVVSLRELKRRIHDDVVNRRIENDVKLGAGGIREVEFIAQSFQLVRGGQDARLRDSRLRPVLRYLGESGLLAADAADELDRCYVFLRRLENAIQMYADEQTHALPRSEEARAALCRALRLPDWDALMAALAPVRERVHEEFQRVFAEPARAATDSALAPVVLALMDEAGEGTTTAARALAAQGFGKAAEEVARRVAEMARSRLVRVLSESAALRLRELLVSILEDCRAAEAPDTTAKRVLGVLHAIVGRSTYLTLLHESESARQQLVRLCAASSWISTQLASTPAALDTLLDVRTLYQPPSAESMRTELEVRLAQIPLDDTEAGMDALRRYRQEVTLRIAAADVVGMLPLVKVSDHLTWLAETVVRAVLARTQNELTAQFGRALRSDGTPAALMVIAYGKFGGIELGYGSDLDLVFVHDCDALDGETEGGPRPVSAGVYFARLIQRMMHWLTTLTPAGRAYEIDIELRPSGNSGQPVIGITAFERYQRERAWTWEHQALTRARAVAGPLPLCAEFERIRREVLSMPRDAAKLRQEVIDMRAKMRQNLDRSSATRWDVKQGEGGLIDIEFITQYLLLRESHRDMRLTRWSDNWRQLEDLCEAGVIDAEVRENLIAAYRALRAWGHVRSLQQDEALSVSDRFLAEREMVGDAWRRIMS